MRGAGIVPVADISRAAVLAVLLLATVERAGGEGTEPQLLVTIGTDRTVTTRSPVRECWVGDTAVATASYNPQEPSVVVRGKQKGNTGLHCVNAFGVRELTLELAVVDEPLRAAHALALGSTGALEGVTLRVEDGVILLRGELYSRREMARLRKLAESNAMIRLEVGESPLVGQVIRRDPLQGPIGYELITDGFLGPKGKPASPRSAVVRVAGLPIYSINDAGAFPSLEDRAADLVRKLDVLVDAWRENDGEASGHGLTFRVVSSSTGALLYARPRPDAQILIAEATERDVGWSSSFGRPGSKGKPKSGELAPKLLAWWWAGLVSDSFTMVFRHQEPEELESRALGQRWLALFRDAESHGGGHVTGPFLLDALARLGDSERQELDRMAATVPVGFTPPAAEQE